MRATVDPIMTHEQIVQLKQLMQQHARTKPMAKWVIVGFSEADTDRGIANIATEVIGPFASEKNARNWAIDNNMYEPYVVTHMTQHDHYIYVETKRTPRIADAEFENE